MDCLAEPYPSGSQPPQPTGSTHSHVTVSPPPGDRLLRPGDQTSLWLVLPDMNEALGELHILTGCTIPNGRAEANHLGTGRGIELEINIQTPTAGIRIWYRAKILRSKKEGRW